VRSIYDWIDHIDRIDFFPEKNRTLNNIKKMKNQNFIICFIFIVIFFVLPLSITSLIFTVLPLFSVLPSDHCSYADNLGFYASICVLGISIIGFILCVTLIVYHILILCKIDKIIYPQWPMLIIIISILNVIFGFAWLAIGGKFLYESNNNCKSNGFVHIFYAITLWIASIYYLYEENNDAHTKYEDL
jgi:hypothetical protein